MQAKHWFESGRKKLITGHLSKTNPNTELVRVLNIADKDYFRKLWLLQKYPDFLFCAWKELGSFTNTAMKARRVSVWIQSKEDN